MKQDKPATLMLLNGCCFITSFFQHFIPPVFLSPATLINPPFHFYKSDRSLLSSSPPLAPFSCLLSLTPSVSSSSRLLSSLRVTLCLPGRSVRSAKVGQLDWRQIGTNPGNNRVNWGWACGRARCSCWQSVLIVDKRGATDEALPRCLIATERNSKKEGSSVFSPTDHCWTQGVTQRNSFISCQDWRNRRRQNPTLISDVDRVHVNLNIRSDSCLSEVQLWSSTHRSRESQQGSSAVFGPPLETLGECDWWTKPSLTSL